MNDPWSHVDGAEIRQRFGRPPIFNATGHYTGQHSFGVSSLGSDNFLQVHNVWLTQYPDGIDTITSVWNIQGSDDHSKVFEFVINLQPSRSERIKLIHTSAAPDLDYPTAFTVTVLGFQAWFQGGAYPLSRDRMYLVSSGQSNYLGSDYSGDYIPFDGLQLVDSAGGTQNLVYDGPLTAPLYQNIYSFFDAHTVIKLSSPGATKSPKVAPGFGSSTLASSRRMHRRLSF